MESNDHITNQIINTAKVISNLPKISVVYATDEMFRFYALSFNEADNKSVREFFKVYEKYGMLCEELKMKKKIFKDVLAERKISAYEESLANQPNRLFGVKKPEELMIYSGKQLGTLLRKFSFQAYSDKRKSMKMNTEDIDYYNINMDSKYLNEFNRILNLNIK